MKRITLAIATLITATMMSVSGLACAKAHQKDKSAQAELIQETALEGVLSDSFITVTEQTITDVLQQRLIEPEKSIIDTVIQTFTH